jgi:hypothetical protein
MRWSALLFAFVATTAAADNGNPYTDRPLDFSLRFSHHTLELDYGGGITVDTAVDRIGIVWREAFGERLHLGLTGGYSYLTQTDNPPTAGLELDGYHAGFLADVDLLAFGNTRVSVRGAWLYQKMDSNDGTQRVSIAWREPSLRLAATTAIGGGVQVYGGLRYGTIDGQQRLSGTLNETRTITESDRTGGFVGVALGLEGNGYVGISAASGIDRHAMLYFGRRF